MFLTLHLREDRTCLSLVSDVPSVSSLALDSPLCTPGRSLPPHSGESSWPGSSLDTASGSGQGLQQPRLPVSHARWRLWPGGQRRWVAPAFSSHEPGGRSHQVDHLDRAKQALTLALRLLWGKLAFTSCPPMTSSLGALSPTSSDTNDEACS